MRMLAFEYHWNRTLGEWFEARQDRGLQKRTESVLLFSTIPVACFQSRKMSRIYTFCSDDTQRPDLLDAAEARHIAQLGANGRRILRPNAGNGLQALGVVIVPHHSGNGGFQLGQADVQVMEMQGQRAYHQAASGDRAGGRDHGFWPGTRQQRGSSLGRDSAGRPATAPATLAQCWAFAG